MPDRWPRVDAPIRIRTNFEETGDDTVPYMIADRASVDGRVTYRGDGGVVRPMFGLYEDHGGTPWHYRPGRRIDLALWVRTGAVRESGTGHE